MTHDTMYWVVKSSFSRRNKSLIENRHEISFVRVERCSSTFSPLDILSGAERVRVHQFAVAFDFIFIHSAFTVEVDRNTLENVTSI